ncbi:biotin transporter BioY [Polycladomyces abyssicola]|uniref:Biotin transporter n=1 Tax=Polycladomyces abyssicola TaxID=1125966 RepID=A0A8D5ZP87_9BACL|nr:biotin transporter BioY [Polycladomyces abyssicola]BCU82772.1 biotin transporter BioY [Polycladomyces abyssicola]
MSKRVLNVRNMVLAAMFAALLAIGGQIRIPLEPVPITLQTLVVMLTGSILGAQIGAISMMVFILLVAFGAPILSGGAGGLGALLGPTGGYVLSWPLAVWVIGWLTERAQQLRVWNLTLYHLLGGVLLVYAAGVTWLAYVAGLGWKVAVLQGALPFIAGDVVKAVVASIVTLGVIRAYPAIRPRK